MIFRVTLLLGNAYKAAGYCFPQAAFEGAVSGASGALSTPDALTCGGGHDPTGVPPPL
ncbi:hypothetical protein [Actinophytocola oryzae]|uniref:Uncharacterized protein n=1 Tax=Actinophytocola oryzae TaxID=502181 RepID=A0A4R7VY77_9PSEU|nr:hypothetical protein [Actinophytocola oryzae]TDV55120.1 hypothetical protein CLV71_103361 [Actinophytocola oryzae]